MNMNMKPGYTEPLICRAGILNPGESSWTGSVTYSKTGDLVIALHTIHTPSAAAAAAHTLLIMSIVSVVYLTDDSYILLNINKIKKRTQITTVRQIPKRQLIKYNRNRLCTSE